MAASKNFDVIGNPESERKRPQSNLPNHCAGIATGLPTARLTPAFNFPSLLLSFRGDA
jgi:hypothetical protein